VDALDQMARLYTVKGGTRCWPVIVFYNVFDMAASIVHVLYKQCLDKTVCKRVFIMDLACEFSENHMNDKKEATATKQSAKAAGPPALPLPQAPQLPLWKKKIPADLTLYTQVYCSEFGGVDPTGTRTWI
jgi:hypothetical protein